jgi:hypothetical protein
MGITSLLAPQPSGSNLIVRRSIRHAAKQNYKLKIIAAQYLSRVASLSGGA